MGASASRIWNEICALESDTVRISMIETVLTSTDMVYEAKRAGVYAHVLFWVADCRTGKWVPFPYGTRKVADSGSSDSQMIVSPAAKALDYFQESLALLGIDESDGITVERLKAGYRAASLRAHPDKGGSKEAFDEVVRAYKYVEKILARINPKMSAEEKARLTAPVTLESAKAARQSLADVKPVQLSAKKLDMATFNRLFEDNRLPDQGRDTGYGDWLASGGGSDEVVADPRLKGKFNQQAFEQVFREKAMAQTAGTAIIKRLEPDAIISAGGVELGGSNDNFTAAFGSDTQFVDLKEAYTSGSTRFHEVADVRVSSKGARSVEEAKRQREAEMSRVDPDEKARFAAAAAAYEEREKQRRMRLAQQDTAAESWSDQMRRRLMVSDR
jgi:curved DNA-binding protein CbpA